MSLPTTMTEWDPVVNETSGLRQGTHGTSVELMEHNHQRIHHTPLRGSTHRCCLIRRRRLELEPLDVMEQG